MGRSAWEEQLADLKVRIDKRVDKVKVLREQGLLEQAEREDRVRQSEWSELKRISEAILADAACQENPQPVRPPGYTNGEWETYVERLRQQGYL